VPYARKEDRAIQSRAWVSRNREKRKEILRQYNASDKRKSTRLRYLYGITWDQYLADYARQEGKCLICDKWRARLHIDHCHATKKYRGLLCDPCNQAIGKFYDNPEWCEKAAAYLRRCQNS